MRFVFLMLVLSSGASAQIFQCVNNGRTTFQDAPCGAASSVSRDLTENLSTKSKSSWDSLKEGKSVCRPEFTTELGPLRAGTAFILGVPSKNAKALLVTAHHLFGPDGGLSRQLSWQELPEKVERAQCAFLSGHGSSITVGRPVRIKNATPYNGGGNIRDMAAFPIMDTPPYVLRLAEAVPKIGDTVWLVARVISGAEAGEVIHRARVVRSDGRLLRFEYDDRSMNIQATSGAPIVNEHGQVVGINFGAIESSRGIEGAAVGLGVISEGLANIQ